MEYKSPEVYVLEFTARMRKRIFDERFKVTELILLHDANKTGMVKFASNKLGTNQFYVRDFKKDFDFTN